MAIIKVNKGSVGNIKSQIKRMESEIDTSVKKVNSAMNGLDFEVSARERIQARLREIQNSLRKQETLAGRYQDAFVRISDRFIETDESFGNQPRLIRKVMPPIRMLGPGANAHDFIFNNKMWKYAGLAGLFVVSPAAAVTAVDINWMKKNKDKIKKVYGNVVNAGKNCVSWIKKNYEERGITYTVTQYAKAIGKVTAGAAMIAAAVGTGGALAGLTGAYGIDSMINGLVDIGKISYNVSNGKTAEIEETQALKSLTKFVTGGVGGAVGDALGNAELGEKIGEKVGSVAYDGGKIVTAIYSISTGWDKIQQATDFNLSKMAGETKTAVKDYYDLFTKVEFNSLRPSALINDIKYQTTLIGYDIPNIVNAMNNFSLIGSLSGDIIAKPSGVLKDILSGHDIEIGGVVGKVRDLIADNFIKK